MKLYHASLFSGIGGAELAASWIGWTNVFHCEIQEFQQKVLEYWFPNSISYEDITKTDFKKWRGQIDVLTGGFPCQPFSVAGKRKGAEDNRYLWGEMLRAIRQIQPTWVVGENVNGILSMAQPSKETKMGRTDNLFDENFIYRKEQKFTIEVICEDLERAGYSVQPFVIPACAVGAPHRRDRVWIIAHRTDTGSKNLQQGRKDGVSQPFFASNTDSNRQWGRKDKQIFEQKCNRTAQHWQKLQTATSSNTQCFGGQKWTTKYNTSSQMGKGLTAMAYMNLLPKPVASDASQSPSSTSFQLNPLYVTEMMGYPLEWLTLPFLLQNGEAKASKR